METDFVSARALEMNGALRDGAEAAARVRPDCCRKRRRVTRRDLPVLIWIPPVDVSSWRRLIQMRDQSSSALDLAMFNVTITFRSPSALLLKPVTRYAAVQRLGAEVARRRPEASCLGEFVRSSKGS